MTEITLHVPTKFADLVAARGLTPVQVLTAFMADLAETSDSNGSDERRAAEAWFDRVIWPEPPRYRLETHQAKSGEWFGLVWEEGVGEAIARIAGCETLDDVLDEAAEQWPGIDHIDLPDEPAPANMREDGEPLTGHDDIDYPPDLAHPGNGPTIITDGPPLADLPTRVTRR